MQVLDNMVGTLRKETHGHIPIILKDMENHKNVSRGNYRVRIEGTIGGAPWLYEDDKDTASGVAYQEDGDVGYFLWAHGNYSCDCNRARFVNPMQKTNIYPCGNYIRIQRIIPLDRPDIPVLELNEPVETIDEFIALLEQPPKAYGLQSVMIGRRPENGGNGLGVKEEEAPTLTKADRHAVCYDTTQITCPTSGSNPKPGSPCHTLAKKSHPPLLVEVEERTALPILYGFDSLSSNSMKSKNPHSGVHVDSVTKTLDTTFPCPSKNQGGNAVLFEPAQQQSEVMVRRLTPMECERLQGFPDGYTDIPVYEIRKGGKKYKPAADSARYAALGNSMTTNVMHWLGSRVQMVQNNLDFLELI